MKMCDALVCPRPRDGEITRTENWSVPEDPTPAAHRPGRVRQGSVRFHSQGDELVGRLFLPQAEPPAPALIVCHGAGEFKENYFELCEYLAGRGLVALALDMRGHGESGGQRFFVDMCQWVPDIRAAIDYLQARPEVDGERIGAFGLSSGGTAILEAGLVDGRLKGLIALDATVRDSMPRAMSWMVRGLIAIGRLKQRLTGTTWRVPLAQISSKPIVASDPEINRRFYANPRSLEAFRAFPLPGAEQAFFVDTLNRAGGIAAPTLVLWGGDDHLDPPETGRLLFAALTCRKALHIIPGNGHAGHLDQHRGKVFELTADWAWENLTGEPVTLCNAPFVSASKVKVIEGEAAKRLTREEKWELLSPFLKRHGREGISYATLQEGMEYFVNPKGYIAYTRVQHPVFARQPKRITFSDPICAPEDLPGLIHDFLAEDPRAAFGVISGPCAEALRPMGFKVNCIGYEPVLPIQTYNTKGNWKELDLIKRARNEARREGITIREEDGATLQRRREELAAISSKWIASKPINDREIWLYARRPVFGHEEDVRKFVAYDKAGQVAGFVFYDPMYRDGKVFGYSANIVRCDERRFGRLATAVHMEAMEKFKAEGAEVFNLLLAPFAKLDGGKYNDDWAAKVFLQMSARFGNSLYNFKGLAFHKAKYRGSERPIYYASNSAFPSADIYLAFASAGVADSYLSTLGRLVMGMISAGKKGKAD
jgi:alpha-beta hydrolase superfamily lysophospholipase